MVLTQEARQNSITTRKKMYENRRLEKEVLKLKKYLEIEQTHLVLSKELEKLKYIEKNSDEINEYSDEYDEIFDGLSKDKYKAGIIRLHTDLQKYKEKYKYYKNIANERFEKVLE